MGRTAAVIWHALSCVAAGVLFYFFVLPRTLELVGATPHTLGVILRVVTGALIGSAALPVAFTLLRTRKPELATPIQALRLRVVAIILHATAGVLIVGAAISEIWLTLDRAGQWLFGVYGAAAAIAMLGVLSFSLAFAAELPPPPPKAVKVKQRAPRQSRRSRRAAAETPDTETPTGETPGPSDADSPETADTQTPEAPASTTDTSTQPEAETDAESPSQTAVDPGRTSDGTLRNRRPKGRGLLSSRRKRSTSGVSVQD